MQVTFHRAIDMSRNLSEALEGLKTHAQGRTHSTALLAHTRTYPLTHASTHAYTLTHARTHASTTHMLAHRHAYARAQAHTRTRLPQVLK